MLSRPRSDLKEKPEKDEKKAWKRVKIHPRPLNSWRKKPPPYENIKPLKSGQRVVAALLVAGSVPLSSSSNLFEKF